MENMVTEKCPNCGCANQKYIRVEGKTLYCEACGRAYKPRFYAGEDYNVGDTVMFGAYPEAEGGAPAPLAWRVVENNGKEIFLLSVKALWRGPYNDKFESTSWNACSLRGRLNGGFYDAAFGPREKELILRAHCSQNGGIGKNDGAEDTDDHIFLLNLAENSLMRSAEPPAGLRGANAADGPPYYWLRNRGQSGSAPGVTAVCPLDNGEVSVEEFIATTELCVRPALKIDIGKLTPDSGEVLKKVK